MRVTVAAARSTRWKFEIPLHPVSLPFQAPSHPLALRRGFQEHAGWRPRAKDRGKPLPRGRDPHYEDLPVVGEHAGRPLALVENRTYRVHATDPAALRLCISIASFPVGALPCYHAATVASRVRPTASSLGSRCRRTRASSWNLDRAGDGGANVRSIRSMCSPVFLPIVSAAAIACAGSTSTTVPEMQWVPFPGELVGTWDWVRSSGGLAGTVQTPATSGVQRTLRCTVEAVCTWKTGTTVILSQRTRLTREQTAYASDPVLVLWMGDPPSRSGVVISLLAGDHLELRDTCSDCWSHEYRRRGQ